MVIDAQAQVTQAERRSAGDGATAHMWVIERRRAVVLFVQTEETVSTDFDKRGVDRGSSRTGSPACAPPLPSSAMNGRRNDGHYTVVATAARASFNTCPIVWLWSPPRPQPHPVQARLDRRSR